jgi:SnoaL-like domain
MNIETLKDNWNAYMAAYGSDVEADRLRLLEQSVCDDVVFANPAGDGKTRAGLDAHIAKFRQGFPGAYFTTDQILAQQDKLLAVWSLFKADGTKVTTGYNFVRPDDAGRFSYMAGFF